MTRPRTLRGDITTLRHRFAGTINAIAAGVSFAFCTVGIVMFFTTLSWIN